MSTEAAVHLNDWIGRTAQNNERLDPGPLAGLAALLGRADELEPTDGTVLPPLAHWLYFLSRPLESDLSPDGHERRGAFLPPVPLPRRLWAGGRLQFLLPLKVGEPTGRRSRITRVQEKHGRSGPLVFVTVAHEVIGPRGLALTEEHDIVYVSARRPGEADPTPVPARRDEGARRVVTPDPVMLFRYSALTFNSHRIHFDRPYAVGVDGYPGLVVHGPLVATCLLDLVRREWPTLSLRGFAYRAVRPLYDLHPFEVCARRELDGHVELWARDHEGALAMHARAQYA